MVRLAVKVRLGLEVRVRLGFCTTKSRKKYYKKSPALSVLS